MSSMALLGIVAGCVIAGTALGVHASIVEEDGPGIRSRMATALLVIGFFVSIVGIAYTPG